MEGGLRGQQGLRDQREWPTTGSSRPTRIRIRSSSSCASAGPCGTASPTHSRSSISAAWRRATRSSSITPATTRPWSVWPASSRIRIRIPRPRTRSSSWLTSKPATGSRGRSPRGGQGRSRLRRAGPGPHVPAQCHSGAGGAMEATVGDGRGEVASVGARGQGTCAVRSIGGAGRVVCGRHRRLRCPK